MSDVRLRQLERAASAGGATERAALLRERVRVGDLALERLRLAAYLGDRGAREAVARREGHKGRDCACVLLPDGFVAEGASLCVGDENAAGVTEWVRGIASWSLEAAVRAASACGRLVLPRWVESQGLRADGSECWAASDGECHWENCPQTRDNEPLASGRHCPLDHDLRPQHALEAAEAWVLCPCDAHASVCEHTWNTGPGFWAETGCWIVATPGNTAHRLVEDCRRYATACEIRIAARDALVSWALGERDPLLKVERLPRPKVADPTEWRRRYDDTGLVSQRALLNVVNTHTWQAGRALADEIDQKLWEERRWLPPGCAVCGRHAPLVDRECPDCRH